MPGASKDLIYNATAARSTSRALDAIQSATLSSLNEVRALQLLRQDIIRAKSELGEYALSELMFLKEIQRIASMGNPHAAGAVAVIVNTTIAGIARTVAEFGAEL